MNDLRNMVETKIPTILEQQQVSPDQAIPPSNQIRGVENNDETRHPETQGGMDKSSILPMLMQVLPSLLQKHSSSIRWANYGKYDSTNDDEKNDRWHGKSRKPKYSYHKLFT